MSVKDAPGEVDNKDIFDSPNITDAEEETKEAEVDQEAEEQKKRETVEIDGVPIDEKDIKYKAEDIRKKKKMKYFVNVERDKAREKAEAKKQADAKRAVEKLAANAEREAEREEKEAKAAAEKKKVEEEKQLKEVEAFVKRQKEEKAREEKKAEREDTGFGGFLRRYKVPIIGAAVIVVAIIVSIIVLPKILNLPDEPGEIVEGDGASGEVADEQYSEAIKKMQDGPIANAINNYQYDDAEKLINNLAESIDDKAYRALVYVNGANKILNSDENEAARAERLVDKAFSCNPEDISALESIMNMYNLLDNDQKKAAAEEKLNQLYGQIKYEDNLTEEDWYGEG